MTKRQGDAIEWLRTQILLHDGLGENYVHKHEYKEWEVKPLGDINQHLVVTSTVGRKDDENTAAEIFCRKTRMIMVGVRGGLRLMNGKRKNVTGQKVVYSLVR